MTKKIPIPPPLYKFRACILPTMEIVDVVLFDADEKIIIYRGEHISKDGEKSETLVKHDMAQTIYIIPDNDGRINHG